MVASAPVALPQPLSPTRPKASRGRTAKLRAGMTLASPARMKNEMRAPSKARIGVTAGDAGDVTVSVTQANLPDADRLQVEVGDERRDRDARSQRHHRHGRCGEILTLRLD